MALLIAALAAEGESLIHNIGQIERGYERIEVRLQALGAEIERSRASLLIPEKLSSVADSDLLVYEGWERGLSRSRCGNDDRPSRTTASPEPVPHGRRRRNSRRWRTRSDAGRAWLQTGARIPGDRRRSSAGSGCLYRGRGGWSGDGPRRESS